MFECGVLFTPQWRSSVKAVHLCISVETIVQKKQHYRRSQNTRLPV